jgi:hypothetical protein
MDGLSAAEKDANGSQAHPHGLAGQLSLSFGVVVATPLPRFLGEENQRLYKREGSCSVEETFFRSFWPF